MWNYTILSYVIKSELQPVHKYTHHSCFPYHSFYVSDCFLSSLPNSSSYAVDSHLFFSVLSVLTSQHYFPPLLQQSFTQLRLLILKKVKVFCMCSEVVPCHHIIFNESVFVKKKKMLVDT